MTRRVEIMFKNMSHRPKNIISVIIFFIMLWNFSVCEIYLNKNIRYIIDSHLMPIDVFAVCAKCKYGHQFTLKPNAVIHIMAYHRKMMHSFLISNYLAKEIINLKNITKWIPLKRKIKRALINYLVKEQTDFSVPNSFADSIKMLLVNGSSQYKLWLKRAIALDDVQTYLKRVNKFTQGSAKQFRSLPDIIEPYTPAEEEYDYGDITGYAYEGIELPSNNNIPEPTPGIYSKFILKDNIGLDVNKNSKNGYGNLYRDSSSHYEENSERLNIVTDLSKQKREINFKDITDIALTTLAYLSFGMFTLQVLMCIVMADLRIRLVSGITTCRHPTPPGLAGGTVELRQV
ncbi:uncharacterized protein [Drosophila takahashii]|uniref:uncharacterized protein isoform X7 n=1 Tax=Drosophila takahashii TaxID=29030 RepID=UPI0038994EDA